MARTVVSDNPRVGQVVYRNYTPAVVGTIIEIVAPNTDMVWKGYRVVNGKAATVRIRWDNKKRGVTDESVLGLADYESLVEDHERKAAKHREILTRIRIEAVAAAITPEIRAKVLSRLGT